MAKTAFSKTQRLVLVIAILAAFVSFLDGSVINVALPAISRELGGGISVQQWVVDAYLITLGSLILVAGSLSDVFGRIVVLRLGLIGFGVASILCAIAPSGLFLIIARGLQGVGGALLVPSSLAIILANFRGEAQGRAIGLWTGFTSASMLLGPILGGVFVDLLSWRLVFAINIIPIAITLWLIVRLDQKDERKPGAKVDIVSAVLAVIGLGAPVFALIEQGNFGWSSPVIWIPFVGGLAVLAAFIWRQNRMTEPLMPLGLFRVRNFGMGNVATIAIYGALSLGIFVVSLYLQEVVGYPATLAAAAFLPSTVIMILLSSAFGTLAGRHGPRLFMTVGPIVGGLGFLLLTGVGEGSNYWLDILPGVIVFGLGLSITVAPLTAAILGSISTEQAGIGSAINNAISRIAGLITTALVGVIVGQTLDGTGYVRGVIVTAALLFVGGVVSLVGISNAKLTEKEPEKVGS